VCVYTRARARASFRVLFVYRAFIAFFTPIRSAPIEYFSNRAARIRPSRTPPAVEEIIETAVAMAARSEL